MFNRLRQKRTFTLMNTTQTFAVFVSPLLILLRNSKFPDKDIDPTALAELVSLPGFDSRSVSPASISALVFAALCSIPYVATINTSSARLQPRLLRRTSSFQYLRLPISVTLWFYRFSVGNLSFFGKEITSSILIYRVRESFKLPLFIVVMHFQEVPDMHSSQLLSNGLSIWPMRAASHTESGHSEIDCYLLYDGRFS